MGAWGTGIFSDDLACDIRDQFRDLIADGKSTEAATKKVLIDYSDTRDDEEEGPTFWIALAATQLQCGRLLNRIRDKAVRIIDQGGDLPRWQEGGADPKDCARRKAALAKLRRDLMAPPRAPVKIPKPKPSATGWKSGHAISYRLKSGKLVILRVLDGGGSGKSQTAFFDLCDWIGEQAPPPKEIAKLAMKVAKVGKKSKLDLPGTPRSKFKLYLAAARDFPPDRVAVVATGLRLKPVALVGVAIVGGMAPDDFLAEHYGIH